MSSGVGKFLMGGSVVRNTASPVLVFNFGVSGCSTVCARPVVRETLVTLTKINAYDKAMDKNCLAKTLK